MRGKGKERRKPRKGPERKRSERKPHALGKKVEPAKIFIYALALAALGGGSYLAFQRIRKKRLESQGSSTTPDNSTIVINNNLPASTTTSKFSLPAMASSLLRRAPVDNDTFPLKRGSQGARVTTLQRELAKENPAIKADGVFGPATAAALRAAGYPDVVDQTLFNKITGASVRVIFNPVDIAGRLYRAAQSKNADEVVSALKEINTVQEYSSVNEYYKKQSFLIARTIVTDLLDFAFKSNDQAKESIRKEFIRIGLKVSTSGKWSLQGIRLFRDLITLRDTIVIDQNNNRIPVKVNTILGDEVEASNGMTWFKSIDNTILKVPSQDVKNT
jgi:hypothetical protein